MRDHPREYGENVEPDTLAVDASGSSPRIRGECELGDLRPGFTGIIPANTGRITDEHSASFVEEDHPREYGENDSFIHAGYVPYGSSPRIRGEFELWGFVVSHYGIIPANTGRIVSVLVMVEDYGDHPREYGENYVV